MSSRPNILKRHEIPALIEDEALRVALDLELSKHYGQLVSVTRLERRFSEYYSSYVMEDLDVNLDNGDRLELVFKNLSREGLLEGALQHKPYFLYDPMREIESYRSILSSHHLGTPTYYGAHIDQGLDRYWLFIERVSATLLWQFGEEEVWQHVARWLALMHTALVPEAEDAARTRPQHLTVQDADYYWRWMERAQSFLHHSVAVHGTQSTCSIDWIAERFDKVVDRLTSLPVTLVHGEFYPSNVLVRLDPRDARVCPVDWEMAAIAPGLIDLAALTSGGWTEEQRFGMAMSYYDSLRSHSNDPADQVKFLSDLDFCNLFMAVQWLGWSPDWQPPPEHAQNWLNEACRLAKKLHL